MATGVSVTIIDENDVQWKVQWKVGGAGPQPEFVFLDWFM